MGKRENINVLGKETQLKKSLKKLKKKKKFPSEKNLKVKKAFFVILKVNENQKNIFLKLLFSLQTLLFV